MPKPNHEELVVEYKKQCGQWVVDLWDAADTAYVIHHNSPEREEEEDDEHRD
jgi:hypothetical protein